MVELVVNNGVVVKPTIQEQLRVLFIPMEGREMHMTLDLDDVAAILHEYFLDKNKWLRKYQNLEIEINNENELDIYFIKV